MGFVFFASAMQASATRRRKNSKSFVCDAVACLFVVASFFFFFRFSQIWNYIFNFKFERWTNREQHKCVKPSLNGISVFTDGRHLPLKWYKQMKRDAIVHLHWNDEKKKQKRIETQLENERVPIQKMIWERMHTREQKKRAENGFTTGSACPYSSAVLIYMFAR